MIEEKLSKLVERLSRKIEQRKAMQMSAEELNLFVAFGGYRAVVMASIDELEGIAKARLGLSVGSDE